ncbi:MAG: glycoside hydrolase 43 family protein [Limisphaerales bacterium]
MPTESAPASTPRDVAPPAPTFPWTPDQGDGTYRNPIIHADYSDPDVVRVGDDFYLTASSFNCTPGLPILHSQDLVNWTIINHAVKNLPHPRYAQVQHGCGIWAPAIRFHNGKFWIFFATPDEGIYLTTADHPADGWAEPRSVQEGKGLIDPCPFWDDDGKAYLVHAYAGSRMGIKHILRVRPLATTGSRLLGEGKMVFHDPERHPTLEGPKFLKKDGWYYILAPAGSVQTGWQVVLRSRNIFGPYEDKIVLEQGSTAINGPHQGALVDTADGGWWFLHFQDAGAYGRVVHLQPVTWKDGWPFMGRDLDGNGIGEPVLHCRKPAIGHGSSVAIPQTSDEFDSPTLGLQWQWQANHQDHWHSLTARPGWLRLFQQTVSDSNLAGTPHLLLQKFPARSFVAETLMDFTPQIPGQEAGLVVMGRTHAALVIRCASGKKQIVFRNNGKDEGIRNFSGHRIKLRVEVAAGGLCAFSFAEEDNFMAVRESFQATAGHWIGAKVGIYALKREPKNPAGHADFKYFRFLPPRST